MSKSIFDEESGLRPKGSVERECSQCKWATWFEPLAPEATVIPYICKACIENPEFFCRCAACNHLFKAKHKELCAMGHHPRCSNCKDILPMQFAKEVHCWRCHCEDRLINPPEKCCGNATQEKHYPKYCDCEACWQTWYHVCNEHAKDWMYDKSNEEQKSIMRKRGAKIIELEDGWTYRYPKLVTN